MSVLEAVIRSVAVVAAFLVLPLLVGQTEHKFMAHMQGRLGPMYAGGWHGWAQLIADAAKFVQKEDVIPAAAEEREYIYGAELMTAAERQAYRRAHESQRDESARAQYERQHRERLQMRARRQGVELREPDGVVSRGDRSGARPGARP
jgi:hypothetical protein